MAIQPLILALTALLGTSHPEPPKIVEEYRAKVVAIADGDTVTVLRGQKQIRVRLEGIDAPERSQAFGTRAKDSLADLVAGKVVTVRRTGTDQYGRTIARLFVDQIDVSQVQTEKGMAWHYSHFSTDETLAKLQDKARSDRAGLWSDSNAIPPWEFRKRGKSNVQRKPTE